MQLKQSSNSQVLFSIPFIPWSFHHQGISIYLPSLSSLLCSSQEFRAFSRATMAAGRSGIYAAVPAVAAAVGFYFFDKNNIKGGGSGTWGRVRVKVEEELKALGNPKVAPQLDGLHCFETLVPR